jgi:hypothetical protein
MYNHACTIAFEVISSEKDGSDITADMIRRAIERRLKLVGDHELLEAVGSPYDTYEIE